MKVVEIDCIKEIRYYVSNDLREMTCNVIHPVDCSVELGRNFLSWRTTLNFRAAVTLSLFNTTHIFCLGPYESTNFFQVGTNKYIVHFLEEPRYFKKALENNFRLDVITKYNCDEANKC